MSYRHNFLVIDSDKLFLTPLKRKMAVVLQNQSGSKQMNLIVFIQICLTKVDKFIDFLPHVCFVPSHFATSDWMFCCPIILHLSQTYM